MRCATLEVIRTATRREAARLLRATRDEAVPGRTLLGALYAGGGKGLHAPFPARTGLARFIPQDNGWTRIDLRRALVIAAWEDAAAAERYEAARPLGSSTEHWRVRVRPVFVTGGILGSNPFGELKDTRGTESEPGLVLTWADVMPRYQPRFVRETFRSVNSQHRHPGLLASFASAYPRLGNFRGFTVSCWRDLGSMVDWAYRDRVHREAMAWFEGFPEDLRARAWFGRFVVERSEGTIGGRNPFAAVMDRR